MDVSVTNHGSIITFRPLTDDGRAWLSENLADDVQMFGGSYCAEPRYAGPIIEGMQDAGLDVG